MTLGTTGPVTLPTRETLNRLLHEGPVVLEAMKADGTLRRFRCTWAGPLIPEDQHPKSVETERPPRDPDLYVVYDLDAQGYRTFRYSKLHCLLTDQEVLG